MLIPFACFHSYKYFLIKPMDERTINKQLSIPIRFTISSTKPPPPPVRSQLWFVCTRIPKIYIVLIKIFFMILFVHILCVCLCVHIYSIYQVAIGGQLNTSTRGLLTHLNMFVCEQIISQTIQFIRSKTIITKISL